MTPCSVPKALASRRLLVWATTPRVCLASGMRKPPAPSACSAQDRAAHMTAPQASTVQHSALRLLRAPGSAKTASCARLALRHPWVSFAPRGTFACGAWRCRAPVGGTTQPPGRLMPPHACLVPQGPSTPQMGRIAWLPVKRALRWRARDPGPPAAGRESEVCRVCDRILNTVEQWLSARPVRGNFWTPSPRPHHPVDPKPPQHCLGLGGGSVH
jgi:hypothetical protein